jgi:phosphatidylserine/phosphatidylglycerophosphate/cardiolipin synthase-like enzyme
LNQPATAIRIRAYHNCDDIHLVWRTSVDAVPDAPIPRCLGFTIHRRRKLPTPRFGPIEILRNRVGFTVPTAPLPATTPLTPPTQPSSIWPFQTYRWTDHGVDAGETVIYRIAAVRLPRGGTLGVTPLVPIVTSDWTEPITVGPTAGNVSAFFNRGMVMSQYVARLSRIHGWDTAALKAHLQDRAEPLREFLGGELRRALLALLDTAIGDPGLAVYAALYELTDGELIERLALLGGRAHVILANGSDPHRDGNAEARAALRTANVDVHDRLLGSKGLAHNKLAVLVRRSHRHPIAAWTGSTNWSTGGLCTQSNNAIRFDDPAVARLFLDQWDRLVEAGDDFPPALVTANAASPRTTGDTSTWFTRTRNPAPPGAPVGADLQALIDLVRGARKMILYVMFQPGEDPLKCIVQRGQEGIHVRGVVSTLQGRVVERFALAGVDTASAAYHEAVIEPTGIGEDFAWWIREVTRREFLVSPANPGGIGHAITHSKMIVIDPFEPDCTVITGSHNFSRSASEHNDENFVVVRGNRALAEAYAVACAATYDHYRWRAYLADCAAGGTAPWSHLVADDAWQTAKGPRAGVDGRALWCPTG